LETANSAITLAKEWRKGGDLPYRLMAVPISLLAILSLARQERPSDLVSEYLIHAGAESLGQWFGPEAPPIIASGSAFIEKALLAFLCLVLLRMLVEPAIREFRKSAGPGEYSRWTLSARAPATFWFAVLAAVQQGPTTMIMQNAQEISAALPLGLLGIYLVLIIAVLVVRRKSFPSPAKEHWTSRSIDLFKCLSSATLLTFAAIVLVPVGFLLLALSWTSDPESQHLKDARRERIREEIENTPAPTGAVGNPLPRTNGFPQTPHPDQTLHMR
jgi:hypothetical protein